MVLLLVFGLSASVTIPFIFAACTITGTLGIVYGIAHVAETPTYVTNLVQLIGLGIAIDYSLLIVYRFREELGRGLEKDEAVVRTMETAGRSVVFSGLAVALGLALLVAMPLPFMRMMGVAGFLIPIVSIARRRDAPAGVALALRPSRRRAQAHPPRRAASTRSSGFWARLARAIMARPVAFLTLGAAVLVAAAVPAFSIELTPGSTFGIPRTPQSVQGFDVLERAVGPGAVAPSIVLSGDAADGSVGRAGSRRRCGRLAAALERDPEVARGRRAAGRALRRPVAAVPPGARRRPARLRLPGGAGVRRAAARRPDPRRRASRRAST